MVTDLTISSLHSPHAFPLLSLFFTNSQDGPGMTYARKIADLAVTDPPTFICHYYNFYFAHTAGGELFLVCFCCLCVCV